MGIFRDYHVSIIILVDFLIGYLYRFSRHNSIYLTIYLTFYLTFYLLMPSTDSPSLDAAWNRLKYFYLSKALNPTPVENNLPFGMDRDLRPLKRSEKDFDRIGALKRVADYKLRLERMSYKSRDTPIQFNKMIKFVPHKSMITTPTITNDHYDNGSSIKLDSSALLFFKEEEDFCDSGSGMSMNFVSQMTNLTSNANGTVSNDKKSAGGIFQTACWLVSTGDLIQNSGMMEILPAVQNNKLRILKCLEFLDEEWRGIGPDLGTILDFVALTKCQETGEWTLLKSDRRISQSNESDIYIYDKEGELKYSTDGSDCSRNIINSQRIRIQLGLKIEHGDLILAIKHHHHNNIKKKKVIRDVLDGLCEILKRNSMIDDYEKICEDYFHVKGGSFGIEAVLVSRVTDGMKEFEKVFKRTNLTIKTSSSSSSMMIKYVSHLDTKIGSIVTQPPPGTFGSTTRHSVIYRPAYFAALHHDASKINRFPETLNYIIRKLLDPQNVGSNLATRIKRISEIQYYAYVVRKIEVGSGSGFVMGLGGGAKAVLIQNEIVFIHESPRIVEINLKPFTSLKKSPINLLLLSPHFSLQNFDFNRPSIEEIISELTRQIDDMTNFKVSLSHFQLINMT